MGFKLAYGNTQLDMSSGSSVQSTLLKRLLSNGTYSSYNWGDAESVRISPAISKSVWTDYSSYKILSLGMIKQTFAEPYSFNRDRRFKSITEAETIITPSNLSIPNNFMLTAIVKGSMTADATTILTTFVDEFTSGSYTNTLAIGAMGVNTTDLHYITDIVDPIKKYEGTMTVTRDYTLPTTEAIYIFNVVIIANSDFSGVTTLQYNIYSGDFQEFAGSIDIPMGSVGQSEISSDYRPELSRSTFLMELSTDKVVDYNSKMTLLITPDDAFGFKERGLYTFDVAINTSGMDAGMLAEALALSIGYYDTDTSTYIRQGTQWPLLTRASAATHIADINNKVITVKFDGTNFILINAIS